jgi:hypothetical protein
MRSPYRSLRRRIRAALGAALLGGAALPAGAQTFWSAPTMPASITDRAFATNLLQESRAQLALARLARMRAPEGRALDTARQAAATWSTLQGRLTALAIAEHAPVRGSLSPRQRGELVRLARMSSPEFQAAYLRDVRRADTTALDRMDLAERASDRRVRRFVSFARPLVIDMNEMAL